MLSARQAQEPSEEPGRLVAASGQRQLNSPAAAAAGTATLNGRNEPKSKQRIANSTEKLAETSAGRNKDSSAAGRRLSAETAPDSLAPAAGGREPPPPTSLGHQSSDDDLTRRLIGANERRRREDARRESRPDESSEEEFDERRHFIGPGDKNAGQERRESGAAGSGGAKRPVRDAEKRRAQLAQQESITERSPSKGFGKRSVSSAADSDEEEGDAKKLEGGCCSRMLQFLRAKKCLTIPLLILVIYTAAIYCLPFIEIDPKIPNELPAIPFDFQEGPLRPSSASAFKFKHLFRDQIHGPESLAFDSQSNAYMAIEGGFILYAHLNRSSPYKRAYLEPASPFQSQNYARLQEAPAQLIKIAELNGLRQVARSRLRSDDQPAGLWRRECQLDEKVYGAQLFGSDADGSFRSNVRVSRCSKPLGIRLSADEAHLYVIDTLTGLYRVNLRVAERPRPYVGGPRQVTKLIDFRVNNGHQVLPAIQLEDEQQADSASMTGSAQPATRLMNVSMKALDDLTVDKTSDNHDLIYMTVASQTWPATSFIYDALEGRPSGLILRYNTANNQLVVLEPSRVAHVRTSALKLDREADRVNRSLFAGRSYQPSFMLGAPRLDENDVFDDRPLNFPNGLELTDDRQALLIADTSNKRIVRHYIRGPRRGTSDLWAWTPMFPDNIRRGYDKGQETYWVVGCGRAPSSGAAGRSWSPSALEHYDVFAILRTWPRLRKFLLKNIYFAGYLVEFFGENLLNSNKIQDVGYELRTGSSLCASGCTGMMIVQFNRHGDVIRSIHSREFPNDLFYYSQVNELIDPENQEHTLYLGSPSYSYLTKLTLPTESHATSARQQY